MFFTVFFPILLLVVLGVLATCLVITPQQHVRMIETFGKYAGTRSAGLSLKMPFPIQTASRPFSMQTRQLQDGVQVKSSDNVFVKIPVYVQFRVIPSRVREAYYELSHPVDQMRSYVVAEIRAVASKMNFQKLYDDKDDLSLEIRQSIGPKMESYGYQIVDVLVDDPQPTDEIIRAFNDVTASHRAKEAAQGYAEAERVRRVAEAKATGEAQEISAKATVEARRILAQGNAEAIRESVKDTGLGPQYGHELVRMSITAETARDAARHGGRTVLVMGEAPTPLHGLYAGAPEEPPHQRAGALRGLPVDPLDRDGDGIVDVH